MWVHLRVHLLPWVHVLDVYVCMGLCLFEERALTFGSSASPPPPPTHTHANKAGENLGQDLQSGMGKSCQSDLDLRSPSHFPLRSSESVSARVGWFHLQAGHREEGPNMGSVGIILAIKPPGQLPTPQDSLNQSTTPLPPRTLAFSLERLEEK